MQSGLVEYPRYRKNTKMMEKTFRRIFFVRVNAKVRD
jgi:hypothetical protein